MPLTVITLEACPCARVGSPSARFILRCRPELEECDMCDHPIWVTEAGRASDLPLVCTVCLQRLR